MENKWNEMYTISESVTAMLRHATGDDSLEITWFRASEYNKENCFTPWTWERLNLKEDEEFFLVYRNHEDKPLEYLYAINVTGDSYLTAASELMNLLSRKF